MNIFHYLLIAFLVAVATGAGTILGKRLFKKMFPSKRPHGKHELEYPVSDSFLKIRTVSTETKNPDGSFEKRTNTIKEIRFPWVRKQT